MTDNRQRLYMAGTLSRELVSPENVRRYERERSHRSYTFDNVVVRFGRWFAFYSFMMGSAAATGAITLWGMNRGYLFPAGQVALASIALGLALAGAGGAVAIWYKATEFVGLMLDYEATEFQDLPPAPPAPDLVLFNDAPMQKRRRPKRVEFEGHAVTFSGRNLDTLLTWYQAGESGQVVRRDDNPGLPGFAALPDPIRSGDYTTALYVLKGRGLIDGRNAWTAAGLDFLTHE